MKDRLCLCNSCFRSLFLAVLLTAAPIAQATTVRFTEIVNDGGPDLSAQLSVDVTDLGSNNVGFTFFNGRDGDTTVDSIIGGIFFDVGASNVTSIAYSATASSGGVLFAEVNGRPNLPEGDNLDPVFTDDSGFKFGHDKTIDNGNGTGIDDANGGSAEFAGFIASFGGSFAFNALLADIAASDFRIGLHVISIFGEGSGAGSDSYVSTGLVPTDVSTVPVPAAAWLFGSALLGFAGWRRKNQKILTKFQQNDPIGS